MLCVGLSFNYHRWTPNEEELFEPYQGYGYKLGVNGSGSVIEIYPHVRYYLGVKTAAPKTAPFLQAGDGVSFGTIKATVTADSYWYQYEFPVDDSTTRFGLNVGGGVRTAVETKVNLVIIGFYHAFFGGDSNTQYLTLGLGLNFSL